MKILKTFIYKFLHVYLNTILLLLFPDGLWIDTEWVGRGNPTRYLFGNYNQIGFVSLLGITTQAMYTFYSGKGRLNLYIILLLSIGSVVFVGSMTSFIGLSIFAAYILLHKHIRHPRIYVWIFIIVYLLFFFFIVWYGNSIEEIKWAAQFIEQQLSKDTTFTFRTLIWENAVYMIQKSPWIGHGIQSVEWNDVYLEASGPHNLWLMLLLQGGRILCISFITIVVYIVHKALKARTMTSILGVVSLCVLFIMSMFETYFIAQIFLLLQFVYYATFTPNPDTITEDANNPQITKI
jgi:O-antigen ligase